MLKQRWKISGDFPVFCWKLLLPATRFLPLLFQQRILPYSSVAVNCKVRAADDGAAGA